MKLLTRKRTGALALALAMTGALLAPTQAYAADPVVLDDPVAFAKGHIDAFNLSPTEDGSVVLSLKEDVTGSHVQRTPESAALVIKSAAATTVPENFLPGMPSDVYFLPLTQNPDLIWPGWDSLQLAGAGIFHTGSGTADININITAVDGPGDVYLWTSGTFGAPASLLTGGGYQLPGTIHQSYLAHVHANWVFTEPGAYTFTVNADVLRNTDNTRVQSNTATYTFIVAPTLEITGLESSYADGADIRLQAATTPAVQGGRYEWTVGGEVIAGQTGPQLELTAAQEHDGEQVSVRFLATPGAGETQPTEIATAPAVTLNVDEPVVQPTLAISAPPGGDGHYHQNSPVVLTAVADPADENASYEWFLQRKDQSAPALVAGQTGPQFTITAEQALDEAKVTAKQFNAAGEEVAAAPAFTIEVDDHGAAPLQQVTVSGAAHHYHTGATAHLAASVSPASVLSRYEWQVRLAGEADWSAVAGENDDEYSFEVASALDGAHVRAVLTFDDGTHYVASAPIEIEIDDHHDEEPVETVLSITGLAEHYHTGQVANLSAVQNPATGEDHYHWFIKRSGDDNYSVIPGELTANLAHTVAAGDDGAEIIVRLYDHDHNVIAESDPAVIEIDDHHGEEPVETVLSITGLAHHYHSGDVANLSAVQNPATGEDHYHWFVKRQSDTAYTVIPGALTADLAYTVTAEDQGAEIIVRLYDHDHGVIAESAPVVIEVDDHHDDENPAPTDPPATPAENALSGIPAGGIELDKGSVEQGGVVRVQVGEGTDHAGEWVAAWMFSTPVLLTTGNGGWQQVSADGTILVRIPASATPGTHSIAVYDAAGALIGWQSIQVRAGDFGTAGAKGLSTTGSDLPGMAIGGIALLVLGAGAVLMLARRRSANEGTATEE